MKRWRRLAIPFLFAMTALSALPASAAHYRHRRSYGGWCDPLFGPCWGRFGAYDPYWSYGPRLDPSIGYIDTDISPEESKIYLDGEYVGEADDFDGNPRYLAVTPGSHSIEVRSPNGGRMSLRVKARGGRIIQLDQDVRSDDRSRNDRDRDVRPDFDDDRNDGDDDEY